MDMEVQIIMGKIATKKATGQLQKLFDYLGEFGGKIETKNPRTWWTLNLEVESVEENKKDVLIGVYSSINGDIIFDPLFHLSLTMDNGKIIETEILDCEETTLFGRIVVDEDDMLHGDGMIKKASCGLKRRFSSFMENMTVNGPYLTDNKSVKKYRKTLTD